MRSERWGEIKRLFQAALDLDDAERSAFLQRECSSDSSLRAEVESLLASHEEVGETLEHPAKMWQPNESPHGDIWLGRKIGPYQPVARIGEGGMGLVYRAVRVGDHFVKQLAIKVLRDGRVEPHQLRRFKSEQQILATLDHPNIARLVDAGTTEDGHPYFVMEYVEGERIDEYCDSHRLNTALRVRLFRRVCGAVQFAHQRLVVHRDLKPANILVSSGGNPKLLDFGIAKLLDPELYFQTVDLTATSVRPMTPDYASPEQARGEAITTASDVYSLGVILYRLLTGHPPYEVSKLPPAKMVQAICEREPEKPSDVIHHTESITSHNGEVLTLTPESVSLPREGHPALLRRRLTGDLDNIVLKALHKDPGRRYGSAEQLADDLGRYLDGLPVQARRDTVWYRTGKYVRRNLAPLGAAALLFLSMVIGVWSTARQARIARASQERAEKRFQDVQRFAHDMIFDVHDAIQFLPGATSARKLIVQDALFYLDSLSQDVHDDPSFQRELAAAYQKIGDVQGLNVRSNLGDTAAALSSYAKALNILVAVVKAHPDDQQSRRDLAALYGTYSTIQLQAGDFPKAIEAAQKYLEMAQARARDASRSDQQAQLDLALAYNQISDVQVESGNFDGGLENARQSLELFEQLQAADPSSRRYRRAVAVEHKRIAGIYEYSGKLDEALAENQKALPVSEALAEENPSDALARRDLSISYTSVADVLLKKGQSANALVLYRRAAVIDDSIAAQDPKDAWAMRYQIYDNQRIGDALAASGDVAGARTAYQKAVTIAEQRANPDAMNAWAQAELAISYSKLADAHYTSASNLDKSTTHRHSDLLAAQSVYQKSLAVWEQLRAKGAIQGVDADKPKAVADALLKCQESLRAVERSR